VPLAQQFPIGAGVTLEQLSDDPHPVLAQLREHEPVSWLPVIDGWLLNSHELAVRVMRDPAIFTVDDPRFSTAQVIGPSMLSLDGPEHDRHRAPFVAPFRPNELRSRFGGPVRQEAAQLIDGLARAGRCELRASFAGPLATATITRALGMERDEVETVRGWYEAIVAAVTSVTAGQGITPEGRRAVAALGRRLRSVIGDFELLSDAAVLLFGGIETTEGMISSCVLQLLERPDQLDRIRRDPQLIAVAIEESLRLEPAAAVIDRYATTQVELAGARIARGELVRISIAGANRDPAVFSRPNEFDLDRPAHRHLAFAQGPHVCLGVHLARLEARIALALLLERLPALRLDPDFPSPRIDGLVFRKPPELRVRWDLGMIRRSKHTKEDSHGADTPT
jgi:cytochrome P450